MKRIYFLPTTLLFFFTACQTTPVLERVSINDEVNINGTGGNPEVQLNQCLNKKGKERNLCIDHFYPEDIEIGIYPKDGLRIKLATIGRGSSTKKEELTLTTQDRIILSVDTTNIKLPLTINIKPIRRLQHKNNLALIIETKNIKNNIIIKDKEGKLLLDYKIIRQKH